MFEKEYKNIHFQDSFNLEICFPSDYPENIPCVKELDKKIPASFHHFTNDCLCLCAPVEQYLIFSKEPTLENYINNLMDPYLLSWLWFERFNEMPWGERKHGWPGLIESYQELLGIHDVQHTILLMGKYVMRQIYQKEECPCGSFLPFKKCHRKIITKLENSLPKDRLFFDFSVILGGLV